MPLGTDHITQGTTGYDATYHDDVIICKHFPRYWPFERGIHRSPVNSLHKGQWRRALMFSLLCTWIHGWVNNSEAGDLRCHHAHYDITVMQNMNRLSKWIVKSWYESCLFCLSFFRASWSCVRKKVIHALSWWAFYMLTSVLFCHSNLYINLQIIFS